MYVEEEMYTMVSDILGTILMQKNKSKDGYVWILGLRVFKVIGLFNF